MPWKSSDAAAKTSKADTPAKQSKWAAVANSARAEALKKGKDEKAADAYAIKVANAALDESVEPSRESIQEYATASGLTLKVDAEKGIISGVKILGLASKNRRTYTPECIAKAKPLYEGAKVNINHPRDGGARTYQDRIGSVANIEQRADGLYAEFHFNPRHAIAPQLLWDAEHSPSNVGFSHCVDARTTRKNGEVVVEEICAVDSVDLVADPATTRGLFESGELPVDPAQRDLAEHGLSAVSDARLILLGNESIESKKARLCEVLATWREELTGETANHKETSTMEWKDITVASLSENRKDLVEQLTGTDAQSQLTAEVKALKETVTAKETELTAEKAKVAAFESEKAKQAQLAAITEELKAAKVNVADKTVCTEAIMAQLTDAKDEAARKPIINLMVLAQRQGVPGTQPFAVVEHVETAGGPGKTAEDTIKLL